MKQVRVLTAIVVAIVIGAGIFYACQKDGLLKMHKNGTGMRVFNSMDELFEEVKYVNSMDEDELTAYENQIGFQSFGRVSESVYWQILKELGEPLGYEYLGDEEMDDVDYEFTVENAQEYVSQYPEYLKLCSSIAEDGEEEYEFLPRYYLNQFSYIMNEERIFQVEENVFKVFESAVIYTSIENENALYDITEDNIEDIITEIEVREAAGEEGYIFVYASSKNQKCRSRSIDIITGGNILEIPNGGTPGTPGCSDKSTGTLSRYWITNVASQPSSNNKVRVIGSFYCDSYEATHHWTADAYYSVYAEWRGCKKCVWIGCKRTLNTDVCMEVWQKSTVHSATDNYISSRPEKSVQRQLFTNTVNIEYNADGTRIQSTRASIYNLTGTIWVATASRTFDF